MNPTTVVIFGGVSGIGEATAIRLSKKGLRVVVVGRHQDRLDAVQVRIGSNINIAKVDATDREAVNRFFKDLGRLDHLVLSFSGGKGAGPFKALGMNDLRSGLEAKFLAQVSVAQSAMNHIENTGSITFVSAGSARVALPGTGRARGNKRGNRSNCAYSCKGTCADPSKCCFPWSNRHSMVEWNAEGSKRKRF